VELSRNYVLTFFLSFLLSSKFISLVFRWFIPVVCELQYLYCDKVRKSKHNKTLLRYRKQIKFCCVFDLPTLSIEILSFHWNFAPREPNRKICLCKFIRFVDKFMFLLHRNWHFRLAVFSPNVFRSVLRR